MHIYVCMQQHVFSLVLVEIALLGRRLHIHIRASTLVLLERSNMLCNMFDDLYNLRFQGTSNTTTTMPLSLVVDWLSYAGLQALGLVQ